MFDMWEDMTDEDMDKLEDELKQRNIVKVEFYHDYLTVELDNGWEIQGSLDKNE